MSASARFAPQDARHTEMLRPKTLLAPNASSMTLTGTFTYMVGGNRSAVIDPGSADPRHLDAIAATVGGAEEVTVIVTHDHPDHSGGAAQLAERTGGRIVGGAAADGTLIWTDEGELVVLHTPGHTSDHIALHWPAASAVFCGDLMMGGLDTTVIAPPEGDLRAYLDSLDRVRRLRPSIIYPAHGPEITQPDQAIDRYLRHRAERLEQVHRARAAGARDPDALFAAVYGDTVPAELRPIARAALEAYVAYLDGDSDGAQR